MTVLKKTLKIQVRGTSTFPHDEYRFVEITNWTFTVTRSQ